MELIKITTSDVWELQKIGQQTFSETFAASNPPDVLEHYLEHSFAIEKLTTELNNEESVFYFVKNIDHVIGYLKLNFGTAQTELQDYNAVEIERIYVLQAFHGQKIGQLLLNNAINIAQERAAPYIWLGVWEENHRALHFYQKNGFVAFDTHVFMMGTDAQTDIMMQLCLK